MLRRSFLKFLALLPFGGLASWSRPPQPLREAMVDRRIQEAHNVVVGPNGTLTVAKLREMKECFDANYRPPPRLFIAKRHENAVRRLLQKERDRLWGVSRPSLGR